jgi:hypothetical protein
MLYSRSQATRGRHVRPPGHREAAAGGPGRAWKLAEGHGGSSVPGSDLPVTVATPIFSISNCFFAKLLLKSCSDLKNSQNMKSSKFQALQV